MGYRAKPRREGRGGGRGRRRGRGRGRGRRRGGGGGRGRESEKGVKYSKLPGLSAIRNVIRTLIRIQGQRRRWVKNESETPLWTAHPDNTGSFTATNTVKHRET